jgi:hypothetical protein
LAAFTTCLGLLPLRCLEGGLGWALVGLVPTALLVGLVAICLADLGLAAPPRAAEPVTCLAPNPWVQPWSDNPIVVRERRREARLSRGRLGALVRRHGGMAVLLACVTWMLTGLAADRPAAAAELGARLTEALLLVMPLLAGLRAAGALASEREARTWEALQLSHLTPREIVHGYAQLTWIPVAEHTLLGGLGLGLLAVWCQGLAGPPQPCWQALGTGVGVSLGAGLAVTCLGLAVGTVSRSAGAAQVVILMFYLLVAWLPTAGGLLPLLGPTTVLWTVTLGTCAYALAVDQVRRVA